jgi:hypothetical protein
MVSDAVDIDLDMRELIIGLFSAQPTFERPFSDCAPS